MPITDAEHGNIQAEYRRITGGRTFFIDAAWTAGENDSLVEAEFFGGNARIKNFTVHSKPANSIGDEVSVLSAEVEDGYGIHGIRRNTKLAKQKRTTTLYTMV
jgi:hypothetical protein